MMQFDNMFYMSLKRFSDAPWQVGCPGYLEKPAPLAFRGTLRGVVY